MDRVSFDPDETGFPDGPVEELVFSSMLRGRVRKELLSMVVGEESTDLENEEEVLRSVREGARERIE